MGSHKSLCMALLLMIGGPLVSMADSPHGSLTSDSRLSDAERAALVVGLVQDAMNSGSPHAVRCLADLSDATAEQIMEQLQTIGHARNLHLQLHDYVSGKDTDTAVIDVTITGADPFETGRVAFVFRREPSRCRLRSADAADYPTAKVKESHSEASAPFRIVGMGQSLAELLRRVLLPNDREAQVEPAGEAPADTIGIDVADFNSPHLFNLAWLHEQHGVLQFTSAVSVSKLNGRKLEKPHGILAWTYEFPGLDPQDFWYEFLFVSDGIRGDVLISESNRNWLGKYGSLGSGAEQFRYPIDLTWVAWRFFVADAVSGNVKVFRMNTNNDSAFPELMFTLEDPSEPVAIDGALIETDDPGWYDAYVAIADRAKKTVSVWCLSVTSGGLSLISEYSLPNCDVTGLC